MSAKEKRRRSRRRSRNGEGVATLNVEGADQSEPNRAEVPTQGLADSLRDAAGGLDKDVGLLNALPKEHSAYGFLADLAARRFEAQDRAFEAITGRCLSVFSFGTAVVALAVNTFGKEAPGWLYGVLILSWGAMTIAAWWGFKTRFIDFPPDPHFYHEHHGTQSLHKIQQSIVIAYAAGFKQNTEVLRIKGRALTFATYFLCALAVTAISTSLWVHFNKASPGVSKDDRSEQAATGTTARPSSETRTQRRSPPAEPTPTQATATTTPSGTNPEEVVMGDAGLKAGGETITAPKEPAARPASAPP